MKVLRTTGYEDVDRSLGGRRLMKEDFIGPGGGAGDGVRLQRQILNLTRSQGRRESQVARRTEFKFIKRPFLLMHPSDREIESVAKLLQRQPDKPVTA